MRGLRLCLWCLKAKTNKTNLNSSLFQLHSCCLQQLAVATTAAAARVAIPAAAAHAAVKIAQGEAQLTIQAVPFVAADVVAVAAAAAAAVAAAAAAGVAAAAAAGVAGVAAVAAACVCHCCDGAVAAATL